MDASSQSALSLFRQLMASPSQPGLTTLAQTVHIRSGEKGLSQELVHIIMSAVTLTSAGGTWHGTSHAQPVEAKVKSLLRRTAESHTFAPQGEAGPVVRQDEELRRAGCLFLGLNVQEGHHGDPESSRTLAQPLTAQQRQRLRCYFSVSGARHDSFLHLMNL